VPYRVVSFLTSFLQPVLYNTFSVSYTIQYNFCHLSHNTICCLFRLHYLFENTPCVFFSANKFSQVELQLMVSFLLGVADKLKRITAYVDKPTMSIYPSVTSYKRRNRLSDFHEILYRNSLCSKEVIPEEFRDNSEGRALYTGQDSRQVH
jgi:hypothetical protein